ncbi:class D sortase [Lentibacillus sp. N15]|uniref:class D sortase n=1 Tax=Lentibacillus songyuanensis TaxID=3136161 RepID=UPI0031B9F6A4
MKKIGIVLIIAGFAMVGWFSYQYWSGMQSVTKLNGDVVKVQDKSARSVTKNSSKKKLAKTEGTSSGKQTVANNTTAANVNFHNGEGIATLVMPTIDLAFDVFWGTSSDVLAKGVGMYDSKLTSTPREFGHTVLSGHRDSVFRPVGDLKKGESIYVRYLDEDYQYQINDIWITDEDDHSVIVEKDEPTLTLSTCYPFHFIGNAPERYIVQADLVQTGDLLNLD